MNVTIEKIKFSELIPIKKAVEKTNMKLVDTKNTTWYGAKHNGKLVAIGAFVQKKDVILFKNSFVLKDYRRKGIYRQLFAEKLKQATLLQPRKIEAYCTSMSVQHFLNNGFQVVNRRQSITHVEKIFPQGDTKIDFPTLLSQSKGLNISIEQIKLSDLTPIKKT